MQPLGAYSAKKNSIVLEMAGSTFNLIKSKRPRASTKIKLKKNKSFASVKFSKIVYMPVPISCLVIYICPYHGSRSGSLYSGKYISFSIEVILFSSVYKTGHYELSLSTTNNIREYILLKRHLATW